MKNKKKSLVCIVVLPDGSILSFLREYAKTIGVTLYRVTGTASNVVCTGEIGLSVLIQALDLGGDLKYLSLKRHSLEIRPKEARRIKSWLGV